MIVNQPLVTVNGDPADTDDSTSFSSLRRSRSRYESLRVAVTVAARAGRLGHRRSLSMTVAMAAAASDS